MSFALTTRQFADGSKSVTRRLGWLVLKPGDRITAVKKAMGRKPGEPLEVLGEAEVISVRRERLDAIDARDCKREGFPDLTPAQFVAMFCRHMKCIPDRLVTRIEFRKIDPDADAANQDLPESAEADR